MRNGVKVPGPEDLRRARKALKLSQAEVADMAGVAENTYLSFELGRSTPQSANLTRILEVLRLDAQTGDTIPDDPGEMLAAILEGSGLDHWRQLALRAEFHRHRQEQGLG